MAAAPESVSTGAPPAVEVAAAGKQDINPWSVSGEVGEDGKVKAIDYRKLIDEFGTSVIDGALLERFERVTGHKPHRFMRRQIVFSHRDLSSILDRYEKVGFAICSFVLLLDETLRTDLCRMSHSSCTLVEGLVAIVCILDILKSLTLSSRCLLLSVLVLQLTSGKVVAGCLGCAFDYHDDRW